MSDILKLFARDPLQLSRQDITVIVEKFRESRKRYTLGNSSAGKTKPPTKSEKARNELSAKLGDTLKFDI